jgi:hypothetical protein
MIEAAILGRPVLTVLLPQFRDSQEGTVHFHYLLHGPDALLHSPRSLDEHARELAEALETGETHANRSARFVRAFVRQEPGVSATTRFVDALEELAAQPAPAPRPEPRWNQLLRPLLGPFADAAVVRIQRLKVERRQRKDRELAEHRQKRRRAAKAEKKAKKAAASRA